ncbi:hypothetical protein [Bordetella phage vB_BbrM_PHB04]|uniref:Uncharacterized protein n=1 Tax=Bordetella phage vB_BbrM_PHB04 TaxID=2029657 RepID=A0A291LAL2_9CAUD|nr:hypothetical protein HOS14_gp038 [Bordetella phage vB_BbrM_PHB04]ATI15656.1 hypothetical protein [Bordetella phage vB_BbrM_PHB04]
MRTPILFIGGPADGRRKVVEHMPELWRVETMPGLSEHLYRPTRKSDQPVRFEAVRHTYRLEHLYGGNGQTFPVYVHTDNTQDTIAMLLAGYREARA